MNNKYKYTSLNKHDTLDFSSQFTYGNQQKAEDKYRSYHVYGNEVPNITSTNPRQTCIDWFCTSLVKLLAYLLCLVTLPLSGFVVAKLSHQYERIIIYRLGRLLPVKGPGVVLVLPCIDRWHKVDLRMKAFNVPPSKVCTTDGCIISVGAIVHFRIIDPLLTSLTVQDVNHAVRDSALSDMTNLLSKKSYHDITSKRQRLSYDLQIDINHSSKQWGVEVSRVELSEITIIMTPQNQRPPAFMPMYGVPPPPDASQMSLGNDMFSGIAQVAQQFVQHYASSNATNQLQETPHEDMMTPVVEKLFQKVQSVLSPDLVKSVGLSYKFVITGHENVTYFLDLSVEPGLVGKGDAPSGKPDVVLTLSAETLQQLFMGQMSYINAYASGQLKINGSVSDAMKLSEVLKWIN